MKGKPVHLILGLLCFVVCIFMLTRSPAWAQMGFRDLMAIAGAGVSFGVLVLWGISAFGPGQGPKG